MWIFTGSISILTTILTWIFAVKGNEKKNWSALTAISFMALTILGEYRLVLDWVAQEDWAGLMDVVPTMYTVLCGYAILIILLNGIFVFAVKSKRFQAD